MEPYLSVGLDGTKKLPTFPFAHMVPVQYEWPWAEAWFDYVHAAVAGGRDGIQTMREYSLVAMQAEKDRVRRLH